MRDRVLKGRKSPRIRQLALSLVQHEPGKHWRAEAAAVFHFVRNNIRFVRDPHDVEMVHTPEGVLDDGQGDCDDQSVLVASLLASIGHPMRFKAVGFNPGDFCHVYSQTKIRHSWVSLDTTEPYPLGWQPPGIYDSMIMHVRSR